MLNIRIIVGLIHVHAYAKLVILETELAKVCKGDRAASAVRFQVLSQKGHCHKLYEYLPGLGAVQITNLGPKLRIDP